MFQPLIRRVKLLRKAFFTDFMKIHYSQFGEDIILKELIRQDIKRGFYVDVGCYHPKKFSNTYALYKRGWRGINIDLEEDKIECFKIARPADYSIVSAVSDKKKKMQRYRFSRYGLGSTIDEKEAEASEEEIFDAIEVETTTLNEIIDNSPYKGRQIDLLSIDAEGHDLNVLGSLDLDNYRPKIILIESPHQGIETILKSEIYTLLDSKGYELRSWTYFTLVFVFPGADILK